MRIKFHVVLCIPTIHKMCKLKLLIGKHTLFILLLLVTLLNIFWNHISISIHVLRDKHTSQIHYEDQDFARVRDVRNLLVNSTCNIPDLDVWDDQVELALMTDDHLKDPNCAGYRWSWVDHFRDELVIDTESIENDGYDWSRLKCGYKIITRISEKDTALSQEHDILSIRTKMSDEFFKVECRAKLGPISPLLYTMYHEIATFNKVDPIQRDRIERKRLMWGNKADSERPPNILIIGHDSTSRLNFRRFMNTTIKLLNGLGSVEMLGYSAVGYGTRSNLIPLLSGYFEFVMWDVCLNSSAPYYDSCPLIWNQFDDAGYLTAHLEDSFAGGIYHGDALGFKEVIVDFYNRPLIHQARGESIFSALEFMNRCIQHQTADEFILEHMDSIVIKAHQEKMPFAIFSHTTAMTHDYNGALKYMDAHLSSYLQKWIDLGVMNNTVLIIMGDHGVRWGTFREHVIQGQFEVNLPNLWITLPPWMQTEPVWQALKDNRYRISSPFTLYWTLQEILKTWSNATYKPPQDGVDFKDGNFISRNYVKDFFHSISPSSSCNDLGIMNNGWCPCTSKDSTVLVVYDTEVLSVARKVVQYINDEKSNPEKCVRLELDKIRKASLEMDTMKLQFYTKPGSGLFDASVQINGTKDIQLVRINKITKEYTTCTQDTKLELYCYCRNWWSMLWP